MILAKGVHYSFYIILSVQKRLLRVREYKNNKPMQFNLTVLHNISVNCTQSNFQIVISDNGIKYYLHNDCSIEN